MIHVHSHGAYVASINRQAKSADSYTPETPWLLLHKTGRVDRFETQTEAKDEVRKAWPRVEFKKD